MPRAFAIWVAGRAAHPCAFDGERAGVVEGRFGDAAEDGEVVAAFERGGGPAVVADEHGEEGLAVLDSLVYTVHDTALAISCATIPAMPALATQKPNHNAAKPLPPVRRPG